MTLRLTNAEPAMELKSVWQREARPGPIRHSMFITNQSGQPITIYEQETFDIHVVGPEGRHKRVVFQRRRQPARQDRRLLRPLDDRLPEDARDYFERSRLDSVRGFRFQRQVRGISRLGVEQRPHRDGERRDVATASRLKAGNRDDFRTDLAAGETFQIPPGFLGAYAGDLDDAGNSVRPLPVPLQYACAAAK